MAKSTKPADSKPTKPAETKPATTPGADTNSGSAEGGAGNAGDTPPELAATKPQSSKKRGAEKTERRYFTVADNLRHDGEGYSAGDDVALTHSQFVALLPTGAIVKSEWSDGEITD